VGWAKAHNAVPTLLSIEGEEWRDGYSRSNPEAFSAKADHGVPFPGMGYQLHFHAEIATIIQKLPKLS